MLTPFVSACLLLLGSSLYSADNKAVEKVTEISTDKRVSSFYFDDEQYDILPMRLRSYQGRQNFDSIITALYQISKELNVQSQVAFTPMADPDDMFWDNAISPSIPGLSGVVYALTVYRGKLIAGGYFKIAEKVFASNIAVWDGTSWSSLGTGLNNSVFTLTVYQDKLIAGGAFTSAGNFAANFIAAWDGNSWSALGSGTNYSVEALAEYDGRLIAGGGFDSAGGVAANFIAAWNGNSWSSLGLGMNNWVLSLAY